MPGDLWLNIFRKQKYMVFIIDIIFISFVLVCVCVLNICICVHMCTCVFRTQRLTSNVARFRGHRVVESLVSVLKNSLQRSFLKMCLGSPSSEIICGRHKMCCLTSFPLSGIRRTVIPSSLKLWTPTLFILHHVLWEGEKVFFLSEAFDVQTSAFLVSLSYFIKNLVKRRKVDDCEPPSLSFTSCSKTSS